MTESLFAIGNGYIGMRANATEGREAHSHGTYLNGFHETWDIKHAEDAFAFAKTGQTIVNVPDAKLMKLYVDDEPLLVATADLEHYERVLDFRAGVSSRDVVWRTPGGKRIRVRSERLVSFHHRHLAMMLLEFTMLDAAAPVVVSSQLMNRQDGEDEYHVRTAALGEGRDPRQARRFQHRVLLPRLQRRHEDPETGGEVLLGYQCANSGMTLACGYQHLLQTSCSHTIETTIGADLAKTVFTIDAVPGETVRIAKLVAYHSSTGVPAEELADRCHRTLARARSEGTRRRSSPSSGPGSTSSGSTAMSRYVATSPPSRRCAGTCSNSPRPRRAPRSRASPPRASPEAATTATTSGTPRSTSSRSSPTRAPTSPASCCGSGGGCCPPLAGERPSSASAARCTRGAPSTARRRRRTTRRAPPSTTSTPRWRTRWSATSTPPAMSSSSSTRAPR